MILYRRRFISVAECWYSAPVESCRADLLCCLQLALPLNDARSSDFKTIWIDLRKPEEQLLREMSKTTRNEVRRALQERFSSESWHKDAKHRLEDFWRFFEQHSVTPKGIAEVRRWTRAHADHGSLDLSRMSSEDGKVLVWHAYYRDGEHARLKYSVSISRNADTTVGAVIGRANRLLHWQDMQRFKIDGLIMYDLGGWYAGTADEKLLRVNKFKEGFGGECSAAFHCTRALTTKGRIYLWAVAARSKLARSKNNAPGEEKGRVTANGRRNMAPCAEIRVTPRQTDTSSVL